MAEVAGEPNPRTCCKLRETPQHFPPEWSSVKVSLLAHIVSPSRLCLLIHVSVLAQIGDIVSLRASPGTTADVAPAVIRGIYFKRTGIPVLRVIWLRDKCRHLTSSKADTPDSLTPALTPDASLRKSTRAPRNKDTEIQFEPVFPKVAFDIDHFELGVHDQADQPFSRIIEVGGVFDGYVLWQKLVGSFSPLQRIFSR
jgi:hypothetical protein